MSKTSRSHSELNGRDHLGDLGIDENMALKYVQTNQLQNSVLIFRVSLKRLQKKYVEAFGSNYRKVFGMHTLKRGTVIPRAFLKIKGGEGPPDTTVVMLNIQCELNTIYNYQSKHNKNYCIMFYNMFYNYMFRPFSLGHLQVVYTRP